MAEDDEIGKPAERQKMLRERVEITADVVRRASALAAAKSPQLAVWADTKVRYLIIRQRGAAAKWAVKAYATTRIIGDIRERHDGYLSPRAARERAAEVYAELKAGTPADAPAVVRQASWTWQDLDREYQAMMAAPRWVGRRMKPPSAGTCNDVRLAFARPSFVAMHGTVLTDLTRPVVAAAIAEITSHRQREKNAAYFKAAMTWGADKKADASGLTEDVARWWDHLAAGDPDAETMKAIEARRAQHLRNKEALSVDSIGEILAAHERYCVTCEKTDEETGRKFTVDREAADVISPGVRFGMWWVCATANRRFSTVKLRRDDLLADDPQNAGWGRAMWPADTMKAKVGFWLPLPPAVRDIATGSIEEYKSTLARYRGDHPSAWVFASVRRHGRDPSNDDVSVYPNSLNRHLLRMREAGAMKGLPYFSLHLARSVMANFLDTHVSPIASSLVLAHTLPQTAAESSPTTREFYLTSQRMDVKSEAMAAWSEALTAAVKKAGGSLPTPRVHRPPGRMKKRAA
jgi:hypothetical protein